MRPVRAVIGVALIALMALVGCAGSGSDKAGGKAARKPLVLTLANPLGDSEEVHGFSAEVSRLSGGTIRIDVRSGWRFGQAAFENGLIKDVQAGKADLGVAGTRAWDSVGVHSLDAMNAPLLIDSYALQQRVLQSSLIGPMLRGLAPLGLAGLGILPGPLRRPLGVARPLLVPNDFSGLRFGVQQSRVGSATMRALGATPVWFAVTAPIAGLGGIEQQISAIQGNRYERVGKYLTTNVVLWPRPLVVFSNRATFAKLTPAQQRILTQAVADDLTPERNVLQSSERSDTGSLCEVHRLRFVTATRSDLVALRRAVQPVYRVLERDSQTRAQIAQIETLSAAVPAEATPRCSRTLAPVSARTPLDGVWQMRTKYGDEPSDPNPVPENYGDWIFVFDRGHFADTQSYRNACTWGYGTSTVKGNQMAWTFTDGGGIQPTNAANKPGESFRFGWSLYRDTLVVTATPGATSPLNFRGKPWHRISASPSWSYFDKRCLPPANALPGRSG
jgi:TRAP-type C4-dicarboxylate transport system substrate-binding protein